MVEKQNKETALPDRAVVIAEILSATERVQDICWGVVMGLKMKDRLNTDNNRQQEGSEIS